MEFASQADEDNAKLRLFAYHPQLQRNIVTVKKEISDAYQLSNDITVPQTDDSNNSPRMNMNAGKLEKLPLEIQIEILLQFDLESLSKLRAISGHVRQIVDQMIRPYRDAVAHAPAALVALHQTSMADHFTVLDFANALYSEKCIKCNNFGSILHLLTCKRICYGCLIASSDYRPLTARAAKAKYGLDNKTVKDLPTLRSLPGLYSYSTREYERRFYLIDQVAAYNAGIKFHGSLEAMKNHVRGKPYGAWADDRPDDVPRGNTNRYMTATSFPSFNPRTHVVDWGVSCSFCLLTQIYPGMSKREFLSDHLPNCEKSNKVWSDYRKGRIEWPSLILLQ